MVRLQDREDLAKSEENLRTNQSTIAVSESHDMPAFCGHSPFQELKVQLKENDEAISRLQTVLQTGMLSL